MIRFLADVNVERGIVEFLVKSGFDVKWIPDYDCEMDDADLLAMSNAEKRILITNDKDFGELTFLKKQNSVGVILIRVKGQDTSEKVTLLGKLMSNHMEEIPNSFTLITNTKFRFIPMGDII